MTTRDGPRRDRSGLARRAGAATYDGDACPRHGGRACWRFGWPLLVDADATLAHRSDAPWLFVLLLPLVLAVVLAEIADGGMDAKAVALLGVLASVGAALRPLGGGAAGFETVFFLLVLSGRVLGRGFGFVLGSVTLFASALLTAGCGAMAAVPDARRRLGRVLRGLPAAGQGLAGDRAALPPTAGSPGCSTAR